MRQKIIITIVALLVFGWIAVLDYEGKNYMKSITTLNEVITEQNLIIDQQNQVIIYLQKHVDGNTINIDHLMDLCLDVTSFI
jgi:hypothetical protein